MPVQYRPGRIQSLNAEQEVVLKQIWAYIFKYYGYDLDIPDKDLEYIDCYVSSTRTQELSEKGFSDLNYGLQKLNSRGSTASSHVSHKTSASSYSTLSKKKKSGFLRKGAAKEATKEPEALHAPLNSERMRFIETHSAIEQYKPIDIDPKIAYAYIHHYKANFENSDDYMSDNEDYGEDDDLESVSSFVTAETSIDVPDMKAFVSAQKSSSGTKGGVASLPVEPYKVKSQTTGVSGVNKYDVRKLHKATFAGLRNDAFDNYVLRFVRARKFKTEASLQMMMKALDWRYSDFKPDEWVIEGDALSYVTGTNPGFIRNYTSQKSFVRGEDRERNPIFFFKAQKHLISESPLADTKRFAVFTIESCRLFLRDITDSVDACSIVFDLTGFSLKNADYNAIKFLAEVFEAYYPECLGKVIIFNAPWIFSTVWNVIKNWLDPVVASKIHFAKDFKEISKHIDKKWIPEYMGGDDAYDGEYPVPTEKDAQYMKARDGRFVALKRERDELFLKFLTVTKRWVESTNSGISDKYLQDKIDLNAALAKNYCELDPYLRCAGFYDRNGALKITC